MIIFNKLRETKDKRNKICRAGGREEQVLKLLPYINHDHINKQKKIISIKKIGLLYIEINIIEQIH